MHERFHWIFSCQLHQKTGMKSPARLLPLGISLLLFVAASSYAGLPPGAYLTARQSVLINGGDCPIVAWRGGDAVAKAAAAGGGVGGIVKTQASAPYVAPLELDVPMPFDPVIATWIEDFLSGRTATRSVELASYDHNGVALHRSLLLGNARLVEFRLPSLEGTQGSERLNATLVIEAGSSQRSAAKASVPVAQAKKSPLLRNAYRVDLPGLETTAVARIHAISWRGGNTPREITLELRGTGDLPGWNAWYEAFVARGNSSDASEKSGRIDFLDNTGKAAATLHLRGVGLLQFAPTVGDEGLIWRARLYAEGGSFSGIGAAAASPPSNPAGESPASAIAEIKGGHPDDVGAGDPKGFPRPDGSVRRSFRSGETRDQRQEFATYSAKLKLTELADFYTHFLSRAGWKRLDRVENESGAERRRSVLMNWSNDGRWAQLTVSEPPGAASDISVRVDTKK